MPTEPASPQPSAELHLDASQHADVLRALAHPLRLKLLGTLRRDGPATASQLAAALGESSGLTSYHLRQLAEHGLIRDDPTRGNNRDRYWQAAHASTHVSTVVDPAADPEGAGAEFRRSVARAYADRLLHFADTADVIPGRQGPEWANAYDLSDWILPLTAAEAHALQRALHEVVAAHRRVRGPADARLVSVQLAILPAGPDEPALER